MIIIIFVIIVFPPPCGDDRHIGKPAEFLPRGCIDPQEHPEQCFPAPGQGDEDGDNEEKVLFEVKMHQTMMIRRCVMDLVLFRTHEEEFVAALSPGCLRSL